jgi:hypothetical protein
MKTKKQYKKHNKLTKSLNRGGLKGGAGDSDTNTNTNSNSEANSTPSYMKYTLIMLGLSGAYMFLKLTKA